jgi:arylsulfatase A-like enzyme
MSARLDKDSLGSVLKDAGYRTAMIGKFINGYRLDSRMPAGWDLWAAVSTQKHFGSDINLNGEVLPLRKDAYTTSALADIALEFIASTPVEQSLMLYFNPTAPHKPVEPERRYRSRFSAAQVTRTDAFNEADVSDKPAYVSGIPPFSDAQIQDLDELHRGRLRMLLSIDVIFQRLVKALERSERLDNTYIFVLSDNGVMMGNHRLTEKSVPYRAAVQVPMVAWGPKFRPGSRPRLTSNADIAPTCAELAGTRMPQPDGISLFSDQQRDYALIFCDAGAGLRSPQLMYFEYATGEREYYDLRNDPLELNNLLPAGAALDPDPPAGLPRPSELSVRLAKLRRCSRSRCA